MSSVTPWSQSVHIFLDGHKVLEPDLRLPPILQLTFRLITSPPHSLFLLGCCPRNQHVWALPHLFRCASCTLSSDSTLTRLPLGLCPPVLSCNLGPSIPCPQSFSSSSPEACLPLFPHPCFGLVPFSRAHAALQYLVGQTYWSLSVKLSLPPSQQGPHFYLQLLFYVVSCYSQLTKSITFLQMSV